MANDGPTPRQPNGPGSSHTAPGPLQRDDLGRAADHVAAVAHHRGVLVHHGRQLVTEAIMADGHAVGEPLGHEPVLALRLLLRDGLAPRVESRAHALGHCARGRAEGEPDMRGEPQLEGAVAAQLDRIAVDHDHARMIGEGRRPAVAEPEVQRRAQDEDEVGLAQGEAARLGEGERMASGQASGPAPFMNTGTPAALAKVSRSAAASSQYTPLPAMMGRSAPARRLASC